jgi:hypothetical protein
VNHEYNLEDLVDARWNGVGLLAILKEARQECAALLRIYGFVGPKGA